LFPLNVLHIGPVEDDKVTAKRIGPNITYMYTENYTFSAAVN